MHMAHYFPIIGLSVKSITRFECAICMSVLAVLASTAAYTGPDYTQYVEPNHPGGGDIFRGANVPHGMIMVDPYNVNGSAGYTLFALSGSAMGDERSSASFVPVAANQGALTQRLSSAGYHHVKYAGLETEITAT